MRIKYLQVFIQPLRLIQNCLKFEDSLKIMWKAKVFFSDYADMCYTHLSNFLQTKHAACFTFQNFLYPGSDDGSSFKEEWKMECFKSVLSINS